MDSFQIFGIQFLLSLILYALIARWYVAPRLAAHCTARRLVDAALREREGVPPSRLPAISTKPKRQVWNLDFVAEVHHAARTVAAHHESPVSGTVMTSSRWP